MAKPLTRSEFRNAVFKRDNYQCVICGESPEDDVKVEDFLDAHHIMERRLFSDGGYYLDNGATLCSDCHLKAESTAYSCEFIREHAGINTIVLPEHLYGDQTYDKWGNILGDTLIAGELFWDESVAKIMGPELRSKFSPYFKYPRTYHVPWSQPDRDSDKYLGDMSVFEGNRVIITQKMDGENTTMYRDHIHARSIDSRNHPSRNWVKGFHASIAHNIDEGMRICGENLYARHTVAYNDLPDFFLGFSVWIGENCLDWDTTQEVFELIGIKRVPVLYDGIYNEAIAQNFKPDGVSSEGWVIRNAAQFPIRHFRKNVAKFVGDGFVLPHGHWTKTWVPNQKTA